MSCRYVGEGHSSRRECQCKGPEAGLCPVCSGNSQKASVAGESEGRVE